jgi:GT2 family glycosyltransferase
MSQLFTRRPLVSIVIPAWNAAKSQDIERCLASCRDQTYRHYEVILVDNGSSDDTGQVAHSIGEDLNLQVVRLDPNRGFAGGSNAGVAVANGKYVLILNVDAELDREYLANGVEAFRSNSRIGAVGGPIFDICGGQRQGTLQGNGYYFGLYTRTTTYRRRNPVDGMQVFSGGSPASFFRRAALDDVRLESGDYYDSTFWCYMEDTDLWFRLILRGWRTMYLKRCVSWHRGGSSVGGGPRIWERPDHVQHLSGRNRLLFLIGTLPRTIALAELPAYCLADALALARCVFRRPASAATFLKARGEAIGRTGYCQRKRRELRSRQSVGTMQLYRQIWAWRLYEYSGVVGRTTA